MGWAKEDRESRDPLPLEAWVTSRTVRPGTEVGDSGQVLTEWRWTPHIQGDSPGGNLGEETEEREKNTELELNR